MTMATGQKSFALLRQGHSLLELIIVMLIVGMGFVIFIPQLLQSRDAFRKGGCALKQAQLAQAVLLFEDANGRLPVGGITVADRNDQYEPFSGKQFSWITLILPQFGLQDTYDRIDFSRDAFSTRGVSESLQKLICPVDTIGDKGFVDRSGQTFGLGNYAAFISPSHTEFEEIQPGALGGFVPGTEVGQRLAQISDGAANTYLLTEVRRRPGGSETPSAFNVRPGSLRDPRGAWALPWAGSSLIAVDYHSIGYNDTPWVPDPNFDAYLVIRPNSQVSGGNILSDTITPCFQPIQALVDGMPCRRQVSDYSFAAPRSLHEGGVNAAFVDGRVEFIGDEIDPLLYAQSISINDGQPVTRPSRRRRPSRNLR